MSVVDFDAVRLSRLRVRAEAMGVGVVESTPGRYAVYSYDRESYVTERGLQDEAPRLTLAEVDTTLSDIESRLKRI